MTVFGYMRVSTTRQAEEGLSIEVQQQQIEAYATINNLTVNVWLRELGVSGSVELSERSEGARLLLEAKAGNVVICSKLDRMFRSASNALNVLAWMSLKREVFHCILSILVAVFQTVLVSLFLRFYRR